MYTISQDDRKFYGGSVTARGLRRAGRQFEVRRMDDKRKCLKAGSRLYTGDNKEIEIGREIGRGAGCIVYDAKYTDSIGVSHKIRVRECCPNDLPVDRSREGTLLVPSDSRLRFEEEKRRFKESYSQNARIQAMLGLINSTVNVSDLIEQNRTCYAVMSFDEGEDYQAYQDPSLKELFEHIRSLAELIGKYHENGYLHLDIKPENIFVIPETEEHILLFDFDSVAAMEKLKENACCRIPFSEGFSAPELMLGQLARIGYHTDIYSVGAVAFYKIFGRKPEAEDGRLSAGYDFSRMNYKDTRFQPRLYKKMEEFFHKSLSLSVVSRWSHMDQVIAALDELIRLSDLERIFVCDAFQYNSECFIGRQNELEKIHEKLKDHQLVFLSGLGGIGKTEIAGKYAQLYRAQYDTVVRAVYESSIEALLNQEILISGVEQEEGEDSRAYFKRRLGLLKETLTSDDLIIIDNFDVDQDKDLEALFSCPCKFIITTREDFRDYNYPQIQIDRMESMEEVMQLFDAYNNCDYTDSQRDVIRQILTLVDRHTMTVELIAKYLRDAGESPEDLYQRFLEKEGTVNTEEITIRQRKDRKLRAESVNGHIRVLFDVSNFSAPEEELIRSLSLLGNIRISRKKFQELCDIENAVKELDLLIRRGWIEYNRKTEKISLHQIILDLVYHDLKPDAENCPHLVDSMIRFWNADTANRSERQVKSKVFTIFMERLKGSDLPYAKLCAAYGENEYLGNAEEICLKSTDREALDLLQKIYRKKMEYVAECEDRYETEMNRDDYYRCKFKEMAELLDKAMESCKKYSDAPAYLAKACTKIGIEVDELLIYKLNKLVFDGRIKELDELYLKIIDVLDLATKNIFLSDLADSDKEEMLEKIRDFYSDRNVVAVYRYEYFLDMEKARWYQEQIDGLRKHTDEDGQIICFYGDEISDWDMAYACEERGDYDSAIAYYEKAYKDRVWFDKSIVCGLVRVYKQAGYTEKLKEYLKSIIRFNRETNEYENDIYVDLIRVLVSEDGLEEARMYAKELLHYNQSLLQEKGSAHDAVAGMTEAYYWLFVIEENPQSKQGFWEEAVKYYRRLGSEEKLTDDLYEFITEYIKFEKISDSWFQEISKLLERVDNSQGRKLTRFIYEQIFAVCQDADRYGTWYVHFLIAFAEYLRCNTYDTEEALHYCETARQYYDRFQMQDLYMKNRIYCTLAECMSDAHRDDVEDVQKIREKCDYVLLAEREIKDKLCPDEKRCEIWSDAAHKYSLVDNFEKEMYCIQKAIDVILPVLGQYKYSSYSNYCGLAYDRILCSMQTEDQKQTYTLIVELYEKMLTARRELNKEDFLDWEWRNNNLADALKDLGYTKEAANLYLYIMYITVASCPDCRLVKDLRPDRETEKMFYEQLEAILKGELNDEEIDKIVGLKKMAVPVLELHESRKQYSELLQWFSDHYEHQEIEFKTIQGE
ncbi:MAG TPA: serine/threonine protein kinase [Lachnospiraceae bacterium]|nr:serine/threonine protein kinase [Lachnospiraceae bacterium]